MPIWVNLTIKKTTMSNETTKISVQSGNNQIAPNATTQNQIVIGELHLHLDKISVQLLYNLAKLDPKILELAKALRVPNPIEHII